MTIASPGWRGLARQALGVAVAAAATIGVMYTLVSALAEALSPMGFLFRFAFIFVLSLLNGWPAAAMATVAMRVWRNAAPVPPMRVAAWFALALAASWGSAVALGVKQDVMAPPRSIFLPLPVMDNLWPFHLAVGALFGGFAWRATKDRRVGIVSGVAGLLASLPVGFLLWAISSDQVGRPTATALIVAMLCAAAFAGAWTYGQLEPKPRPPAGEVPE